MAVDVNGESEGFIFIVFSVRCLPVEQCDSQRVMCGC